MKSSLRLEQIVALRDRGYTLQVIGDTFGISRERVQQILRRDSPSHLHPSGRFVPKVKLAEMVGVSVDRIDNLIIKARVSPTYMGKKAQYPTEGVEIIKRVNSCWFCGKPIPKGRRHYCSGECLNETKKYENFSPEQKRRHYELVKRWHLQNPGKSKVMISQAWRRYYAKRRQGVIYAVKSGGKEILQGEIVENAGQKVGNRIPVKWRGQVYYIPWGNLRKVNIPARMSGGEQ